MTTIVQPSFGAGEVDPSLYGRVDKVFYYIGLRTAKNMIVNEGGGIYNREGSRHIGVTKDEEDEVRLLSFNFGSGDTYLLEVGNRYIRFIRNDAYVEDPMFAYSINNISRESTTIVTTSGSHSFQTGNQVFMRARTGASWNGMFEIANRLFNIRRISNTRFELRDPTYKTSIDSRGFSSYVSGAYASKRYEVSTPYSLSDLEQLQYVQTGDIIELVHPNYVVHELARSGHSDWELRVKRFFSLDGNAALRDLRLKSLGGTGFTSRRFLRGIVVPVTEDGVQQTPLMGDTRSDIRIRNIYINNDSTVGIEFDSIDNVVSHIASRAARYIAAFINDVPYYVDSSVRGTGAASSFISDRLTNATIFITGTQTFGTDGLNNRFYRGTIEGVLAPSFTSADFTYTMPSVAKTCKTPLLGFSTAQNAVQGRVDSNTGTVTPGVKYRLYLAPETGSIFYFSKESTYTDTTDEVQIQLPIYLPNSKIFTTLASLGALVSDADDIYDLSIGSTVFNEINKRPGVVAYHYQRTVYGASNSKPDTLFYSGIGDRFDFTDDPLVTDDSSFSATLASSVVNQIISIIPLGGLVILTKDSQWLVEPVEGAGFTARTIKQERKLKIGAASITPILFDNNVIFVRKGAQSLVSISYDDESGTYTPISLTPLAKHLFRTNTIVRLAAVYDQFQRVLIVRSDGTIAHLTLNLKQQFLAWARWDTDGKIEDIHSITDEGPLYALIRRRIGGKTRRHIEKFVRHRSAVDIQDMFYVDDGLTYDVPVSITNVSRGTATTVTAGGHGFSEGDEVIFSDIEWEPVIDDDLTVSHPEQLNNKSFFVRSNPTNNTFALENDDGIALDSTSFKAYIDGGKVRKMVSVVYGLSHLEGREVVALADGIVEEGLTVGAGGRLDLPMKYGRIHVGLRYVSEIETLNLETSSKGIQGDLRRTSEIVVRMDKSRGLLYKTSARDNFQELFPPLSKVWSAPAVLRDGDITLPVPSDWNETLRITMRQKYPLPMGILAIVPDFDRQDDK